VNYEQSYPIYLDDLDDLDEYEYYEEWSDPSRVDRRARRARKPRVAPIRERPREIVEELVDDAVGLEGGFETTYRPSRHEQEWLLASLHAFYDRGLINDVLSLIKGGKEANVYRCQADPATGATVLAAKVYRPNKFRRLRNDSLYREGRAILNAQGHDHDYERDQRVLRALKRKSEFGRQVQHTSWLMHEYTAMERLYQEGGAVPQPVAAEENAILMSYHGDAGMAAPTLSQIRLEPEEAEKVFQEVRRNIELMLSQRLVHGDLSAFNILYWEGEITLIDFPQVIDLYGNENAYWILERDIRRTCEYFQKQGAACDPEALMGELWHQYGYGEQP
jgi:RIO kinase 1